jgi:GntR family transcriptional regulator
MVISKTDENVWRLPQTETPGAKDYVRKGKGALPAYLQLAQLVRGRIASGKLKPGDRIPPASTMAEKHGVSPMTVRQAVSVLVDEGLVKRVHGSGTYVRKVEVGATSFALDAFNRILSDTKNLEARIIKSKIERVKGAEGRLLNLNPDSPVILVERLILHRDNPYVLQVAYLPFDPASPVVEDMLDTTGLSGLFINDGSTGYKKGSLRLLPMAMDESLMKMLSSHAEQNAFKLEYLFYNFKDSPCAYGWFIIPQENMPLVSQIGVWND